MRARVPLLLLALAGACSHVNRADPRDVRLSQHATEAAVGEARGALRVATYNVHGSSAEALLGALRSDPTLEGVDVLFLQEIEIDGEDTPSRLAALLRWSFVYAPGYRIGRDGSHGVAIVSRLALEDPSVIELPRYHVVFNSARRVAIAATVHLDGQRVRVYSVHLDNRVNPADRVAQLAPVLADARSLPGMPIVIAGDMNTSPFCWLGHVVPLPCGVQDDRLEAAVRADGFDTPVRDSGPTSEWLSMKLDAIYTRGLDVAGFDVRDRVRASDHLPLWAELRLPVGAIREE